MAKKNEEQLEKVDPIIDNIENEEAETQPIIEYEAICRTYITHNKTNYSIGDLIYLTDKSAYERLLELQAIE